MKNQISVSTELGMYLSQRENITNIVGQAPASIRADDGSLPSVTITRKYSQDVYLSPTTSQPWAVEVEDETRCVHQHFTGLFREQSGLKDLLMFRPDSGKRTYRLHII